MITFLMLIINFVSMITIVMMPFMFEMGEALLNMVIVFTIVMALNYIVIYMDG
jgi:hypothetical protein